MQNTSSTQRPPSHLFYQSRLRRPLVDRAEGIYLWDQEGRRMIDGSSGAMVVNIGHGNRNVLDAMKRGLPGVAEAAASKVASSLACQNVARAALDFGGPEALADAARPNLLYRQSMWETIGGGTSEVMRGIVAKQALGLGGRS